MMKKYRWLVTGAALTILIVCGCIFLPGLLLDRESGRDVNRVVEDTRAYQSQQIRTGDIDMNLNMRVMMLGGQWKCSAEAVTYDESMGNLMLFQVEAEDCLVMTFRMWMALMDNYFYGMNCTPEGDLFRDAVPENVQCQLYRYSDEVLNTLSFYVWDCHCDCADTGISVDMCIDAVTMEIYRISLKNNGKKWTWDGALAEGMKALDEISVYNIEETDFELYNDLVYSAVFIPLYHNAKMYTTQNELLIRYCKYMDNEMYARNEAPEGSMPAANMEIQDAADYFENTGIPYTLFDSIYIMSQVSCSVYGNDNDYGLYSSKSGSLIVQMTYDEEGLVWWLSPGKDGA